MKYTLSWIFIASLVESCAQNHEIERGQQTGRGTSEERLEGSDPTKKNPPIEENKDTENTELTSTEVTVDDLKGL